MAGPGRPRKPTEESQAIDAILAAIEVINEKSKVLGLPEEVVYPLGRNPFVGIVDTSALDGFLVGKPVIPQERLDRLKELGRKAKTDHQALTSFLGEIAFIGARAAKGIA